MERLELIQLLGARAVLAEPTPLQVIEERDPERFMAAFAQAVAEAETILVCDPAWGAAERAQLAVLRQSKIENPKSKMISPPPRAVRRSRRGSSIATSLASTC